MKNLILENKTGFTTLLPFIIYELNGNVFYSSDFVNKIEQGKRLNFNIPAGRYTYDGAFIKLDNPVKFKVITLPIPERNLHKKKYKIIFSDNPNKCSIFYSTGIILFDNVFKIAPLYIKYGIYFHELGHHLYKTEKFADLYAVKKMLDYGFNPSQIGRVSIFGLSSESMERKDFIVKKLTDK